MLELRAAKFAEDPENLRPTKVPLWLARVCFVLIGMLLGAVVTPATLRGMATWPLSITLLALYVGFGKRRGRLVENDNVRLDRQGSADGGQG